MYRVVLVDDEATALKGLKMLIDWEGHRIEKIDTAESMSEAMELFEHGEVHIMLCDIEMQDENGLDLVKWVRQNYPKTVCILLTGHAKFEYAKRAINVGAFRYLLKPVPSEELEDTINTAITHYNYNKMADHLTNIDGEYTDLLDRAKSIVCKHISENITRETVAKEVHISPQHLSRIFRQNLGMSFSDYVQNKRIKLSIHFLEDTNENIEYIADKVGYRYSSYFTKIFKKETGMSPREYRSRHRMYK